MDTIGSFPHFDLDNVKNSAPTCQTADEGGVIIPRFHFKFIAFPFNAGGTSLYTCLNLLSRGQLAGAFKKIPALTGSHLFRSLCRGSFFSTLPGSSLFCVFHCLISVPHFRFDCKYLPFSFANSPAQKSCRQMPTAFLLILPEQSGRGFSTDSLLRKSGSAPEKGSSARYGCRYTHSAFQST